MQGHVFNSGVKGSKTWLRSPGYTADRCQGPEGATGPAASFPWVWAWLQCGVSSRMGLPGEAQWGRAMGKLPGPLPPDLTVVTARPPLPVSWGQAVASGWGAQPAYPMGSSSGFFLARKVRRLVGKRPLGWVRSEKQLKISPFLSLNGGYFDFFFLKCVFYW